MTGRGPDRAGGRQDMARVLVVEDEDVTRELLELRLSGAGHWVRTAAAPRCS